MEEAVWGPTQTVKESTLVKASDSNSTLKNSLRKEKRSVWSKTKSILSVGFSILAVVGWVVIFILLIDAFFNDAKVMEWILIGY